MDTKSDLDFDPNLSKEYSWSTYSPERTPKYKVHFRKGDAINALLGRRSGILFHYDGTKWVTVLKAKNTHVEPKDVCDHCLNSTRRNYHPQSPFDSSYRSGKTKIVFTSPETAELQYWCDHCR